MNNKSRINLVIAHALEAKPLCTMFGLKRQQLNAPFPVYQNDDQITLIVSGMGKIAAAGATAYLAAKLDASPACGWLNIGIAGHGELAIGDGVLANKITEAATGSSFYPPQLLAGFQSGAVVTVDAVERSYPVPAAYEMEAYGFYAAATRHMSSELVQVFKIVSDNPDNPVTNFNINDVDGLISNQAATIQSLVNSMNELLGSYRKVYSVPASFNLLIANYRFSVTQQSQLRRLCERYEALQLQSELTELCAQPFASGRQLLTVMTDKLDGGAGF